MSNGSYNINSIKFNNMNRSLFNNTNINKIQKTVSFPFTWRNEHSVHLSKLDYQLPHALIFLIFLLPQILKNNWLLHGRVHHCRVGPWCFLDFSQLFVEPRNFILIVLFHSCNSLLIALLDTINRIILNKALTFVYLAHYCFYFLNTAFSRSLPY